MSRQLKFDAPDGRMVSMQEAADYLGISKSSMIRLVHKNPDAFPRFEFGRAVRFRLSDVDAYATAQAAS